MKKLLVICMSLFLFGLIILPANAFAEEFALTKIGSISLNGKTYNHFWFEPTNLTMQGTGSRGANIDITIDGNTKTINASVEDGGWKYTHDTPLEKKDHNVTIASGDQRKSFILTIGANQVPEDQQSSTGTDTLPETGNLLPTLGLFGLVGALLYFGFRERRA